MGGDDNLLCIKDRKRNIKQRERVIAETIKTKTTVRVVD